MMSEMHMHGSMAIRNTAGEKNYRKKHSSPHVRDMGQTDVVSRMRGDEEFRHQKSSQRVKKPDYTPISSELSKSILQRKKKSQKTNIDEEFSFWEGIGGEAESRKISMGNVKDVTQELVDKVGKIPDNPVVNLARQCKRLGIKLVHGNLRIYQNGAMVPVDYDLFRKKLDRWIQQREICVENYPSVSAIRDCYQHLLAVSEDDTVEYDIRFEKSKNLIVFENGTYDSATGRLREHSKKDFVPFRIRAKYLLGEVCTPVLDQLIRSQDTTGEYDDLRELFLEAIGYYFIANAAAKKFVYCAPQPDSGKSVLGAFMHSLFYPDAVSTEPINSLGEKFSQGDIWKKSICISMDLSDEILSPKAIGRIKNLTGDACVNTEEKYMPKRTSYHYCKYFFASNGPLRLRKYDEAFFNRVIILPFLTSIPRAKMDMKFQHRLIQEKDAIATLAARSLGHLIDRNFEFPKLKITEKLKAEWSGNYREPLVQFVQMKCTLAEGEYVFFEDVYFAYCEYCKEFAFLSLEKREFGKRLLQLYRGRIFAQKKRKKGGDPQAGYMGIALNQEEMLIPVRRDGEW